LIQRLGHPIMGCLEHQIGEAETYNNKKGTERFR
jgi:hypothetical protein